MANFTNGYADKVVVITGGATGIGLGLAHRFGADGARLVLAGRRQDRLEGAATTLTEAGIDATWEVCDVTDRAQVEALADAAWERHGRVDVIINNAGRSQDTAPVLDTPVEHAQAVLDVNLFGVWHGVQVFGRRLVDQGTPAAIYNVGSENSLFNAVPGGAAYVASKHAVLAVTEALREEVPDFIDVALICPGLVQSELIAENAMALAMDTDRFVDVAFEQLRAGHFFVVSHAYNKVRIDARHDEVSAAYDRYAPRYEGDDEFDVRTLIARVAAAQG